MMKILITEKEGRLKDLIVHALSKQGYSVSLFDNPKGSIIEIDRKDIIKDAVVNLGDFLFKEKQGGLYKAMLEIIEKPMIEHVLERTEGNQLKAARILGINRNTMRNKIKKLGINIQRCKTS